jgi:hypothetical protein
VLDCGGPLGGEHVEVGHDERVGVDGVGGGEFGDGQGALVGVQGAAPPGPGIGRDLARGDVECDRRISSRVAACHQSGQ